MLYSSKHLILQKRCFHKKTGPSLRVETQINHITRTVLKLRLKPKTKMWPREKPEAELGCGKGGAGVKNVKLDDNEVRRPVR